MPQQTTLNLADSNSDGTIHTNTIINQMLS